MAAVDLSSNSKAVPLSLVTTPTWVSLACRKLATSYSSLKSQPLSDVDFLPEEYYGYQNLLLLVDYKYLNY